MQNGTKKEACSAPKMEMHSFNTTDPQCGKNFGNLKKICSRHVQRLKMIFTKTRETNEPECNSCEGNAKKGYQNQMSMWNVKCKV